MTNYRSDFYYRILGFFPPSEVKLGAYGFSTELDAGFAARAMAHPLTDRAWEVLQDDAKRIIVGYGLAKPKEQIMKGYHFIEQDKKLTSLLHFCTVPGNACDLGVDWSNIEDLKHFSELQKGKRRHTIGYNPHNVDHFKQADALLALWLHWQNVTEAILSSE